MVDLEHYPKSHLGVTGASSNVEIASSSAQVRLLKICSFIVKTDETGPQAKNSSPVVILSSDDEEEVVDDVGEVTYVGRARQSQGGMRMVMTVDEVLKQRRGDGLSYAWKCKLGKLDD